MIYVWWKFSALNFLDFSQVMINFIEIIFVSR